MKIQPGSTVIDIKDLFNLNSDFEYILEVIMAASQAAFKVEQAVGHDGSAVTQQDVSNPALDRSKYADPSGEKMKALVWLGKNHVEVRTLPNF